MSSFMYPNSATRKMYGQVGQSLARISKNHKTDMETIDRVTKGTIGELRNAVMAYENLGWWKRLWLLVLEIFGKRKPILP